MNLCTYKDVLGVPGQGIHSYRVLNIAIMDVLMTIVAAILISYSFRVQLLGTTIVLFLLGITLHHVFCVRTTVDTFLFGS